MNYSVYGSSVRDRYLHTRVLAKQNHVKRPPVIKLNLIGLKVI